MINWQLFPKSNAMPDHLVQVVDVFKRNEPAISSANRQLNSDAVLAKVADGLEECGFRVERSKRGQDKIRVPVLFGKNGRMEKAFDADGLPRHTNSG